MRAKDKGLGLRLVRATATSAQVLGDPLRLRQVLVNLVDNAIKLTQKGEVVLRLEAGTPVADALPLRIRVRAGGIGLPAAQRSMSFQHFTRADGSTARKHGGTGPGLASAASSWVP